MGRPALRTSGQAITGLVHQTLVEGGRARGGRIGPRQIQGAHLAARKQGVRDHVIEQVEGPPPFPP